MVSLLIHCYCTLTNASSDFNYEWKSDGSCGLVPGFEEPDHSLICQEDANAIEYFKPTGYRRIPLTTCDGGREMDKIESVPCPGREPQYQEKHGISSLGLFFAIVIPITAAFGVGYWVWRNWEGKFGQIRLGDSGSAFDRDGPLVAIPVAIIAGAWAVIQATPLLVVSLFRSAKGWLPIGRRQSPYTSRGAFAARRGEYVGVVDDEDELLGDDLDEEGDV